MSWKIRHEGSPRSIEGLTLQQILEGLRDGLWEPTDEVMGPQDQQWVAMEAHPQLAEVVADLEPPQRKEHEDETRLDMNPLIDVALVLLIFFILTTTYETIRKVLDMPSVAASNPKNPLRTVKPDQVKEVMIRVVARNGENGPVVQVEDRIVDIKNLTNELKQFVKGTRKTEMLIDAVDVNWGTVVAIQDAAKGAGIQKAYILAKQPTQ
ncbi:MAG: biopolymer transporter ExbD [Gemmataceae bacterium]|nr:biopolymer transporter ExbD [Gemmataceae bacterium]